MTCAVTFHLGKRCPTCGAAVPDKARVGGYAKTYCSTRCWQRSPQAQAFYRRHGRAQTERARQKRPPQPCAHCGRLFRNPWSRVRYCSRGCWYASDERRAFVERSRRSTGRMAPPPSPDEIALLAAAIRAEWTDLECLQRVRIDWRAMPWTCPQGELTVPEPASFRHG